MAHTRCKKATLYPDSRVESHNVHPGMATQAWNSSVSKKSFSFTNKAFISSPCCSRKEGGENSGIQKCLGCFWIFPEIPTINLATHKHQAPPFQAITAVPQWRLVRGRTLSPGLLTKNGYGEGRFQHCCPTQAQETDW